MKASIASKVAQMSALKVLANCILWTRGGVHTIIGMARMSNAANVQQESRAVLLNYTSKCVDKLCGVGKVSNEIRVQYRYHSLQ